MPWPLLPCGLQTLGRVCFACSAEWKPFPPSGRWCSVYSPCRCPDQRWPPTVPHGGWMVQTQALRVPHCDINSYRCGRWNLKCVAWNRCRPGNEQNDLYEPDMCSCSESKQELTCTPRLDSLLILTCPTFSAEVLLIWTSRVEMISPWWALDFVMLYKCRVHLGFISSLLRSLCPDWWAGASWEGWLRAWGICPIAGRRLPLVPPQAGASFMVPWEHSWREGVHF